MTINIEAISFNHDRSSATTDALTIRNQVNDVPVPEWRSGMSRPEDSPAAYTISQIQNNRLTIQVQFRRGNSDPASVTVHAVARNANVLGNVVSRTISFENGVSTFGLFELDPPPRNPGVGVWDIAWDWFAAGVFLQTTRHRIYTLVRAPQPPWGQPGSTFADYQLPWTEVLDHACRQAARARTVDEVADKLTRWLFSLGGSKLQYDESSGDSHFTIPGMKTFRCTRFLQHLAAGIGTRARVNCTDCATILSSFANILGCNLVQSRIGFDFQTNLIQKIGLSYPYRQPFRFHEVAWRFPSNGNGDAYVFDSCLQFDGDRNLADDRFSPALGINLPVGVPGREGYHYRLIAPTPAGRAAREKPLTRLQRKIEGRLAIRAATDPEHQRLLADEYDFESWQGTPTVEPDKDCEPYQTKAVTSSRAPLPQERPTSDSQLLVNYTSNPERFSPSGWKLREVEHFEAEPDPFKLSDAIWTATDCSKAELRVLTYECSTIAAARLFVLGLLAEFQVPSIKRRHDFIIDQKQVEIGDVAFADLDELVLLFARANTVLLIQNAGRTVVPVSQFAHEIDTDIASKPDPKEKDLPEMDRFSFSDEKMRVGDDIPMQCRSGSPKKEQETLFKFLAPGGQVFLKGDDLLYRPFAGGEQSITILGIKAGQPTVRQVLNVSVEQPVTLQETPCRKLDKPDKEEESVMPDVLGSWSSIRPTSDGGPADLTVDGFIYLNNQNPATGEITGNYADIGNRTIEYVTGQVTHVPPNSYRLVLRHPTGDGNTRQYEGDLVAIDEGDFPVHVVVGRYSHYREDGGGPDSEVALGSQENGIWVATKP